MESFFEKLEHLLIKLFSNSSLFILIGDININVLDTTDPPTQRLRDTLRSFNLKWSINSPTRITDTTRTAIDNAITNIPDTSVSVVNAAVSDHFAQEVVVQGYKPDTHKPVEKVNRIVKARNISLLNNCLKNESWRFLDEHTSTEEMFSAFNNCFNYYLDITCPKKISKLTLKTKKISWITKGILVSREKLKYYHSIFITTQNEEFKVFFRRYRQIYKKIIKAAKAYDVNRALHLTDNFSKTAWRIINNLKGGQQNSKTDPKKIQINDCIVEDPLQIANWFNTYFASTGRPPLRQAHHRAIPHVREPVGSMVITTVDEGEVERVIRRLNGKRSCDINGMSVWLLKQCYKHLLTPLTKIINSSFETGFFPSLLKIAKIVPIYKKDDPCQTANYRPISILPVFSKVLEKIFCEKLEGFLEHNGILCPEQFGFRKQKSTIDAINNLIVNVVDGLERREHVLSIFLDLSKAFDCVHHETLLHQLEVCGIRGLPHAWITSYLRGREQCVQISNILSNKVQITQGVPQGSILGPLLFLIYVNNLNTVVHSGHITQYADDTTLCFRGKTAHELEIESFIELNSCIQYFLGINLLTNRSKSNFINFSLRQLEHAVRPTVSVDDEILEETVTTKFLGMHLDQSLTWGDHIDGICAKLASGIFALRNLGRFCSTDVMKMAYYGLIFPHFAYGIRLWGGCTKQRFQRIFRLQKKAVRIIKKLEFRESCKNAFRELGLLTLPCLYVYEVIVYCRSKCDLLQGSDVHQYETRGRATYRVQQHRLTVTDRLPEQVGVRLINRLPESIKEINNTNVFKRYLKSLLITKSFYSVDEFVESRWEI